MTPAYLTAHERAAALAQERAEEARAELARMPAWRRSLLRVRVPSRLVLAACLFFALKLVAVLALGPSVWSGAKCTRHARPLWNTSFADWHELVPLDDTPALAAFVAAANGTLLLGHATRDAVELVQAWACSARRAGLEPRVVSLDGEATCDALRAGGVPCLFLRTHAGSLSPASPFARAHATQHRLTQRARLAWRVLALGRDVLLSDADVVFLKPFAFDAVGGDADADADADADLVVLAERGSFGVRPNFGFVLARASPRTVAFFQMLHHAQASHQLGADRAYAACSLWSSLRLAYFDERAFVVGSSARREAASLVHLSALTSAELAYANASATHAEQKAALLRALGLWCA